MTNLSKLLPAFFLILITLVNISCKEEVIGTVVSESEIIGTWQLTKIIASYPSGVKELTPAEENISFTITLNDDKTYQRNQDYNGDIINESGNWSLSNGKLTLNSTSGFVTFPIKMNDNALQVATSLPDPDSGLLTPVTLEFTKQ